MEEGLDVGKQEQAFQAAEGFDVHWQVTLGGSTVDLESIDQQTV